MKLFRVYIQNLFLQLGSDPLYEFKLRGHGMKLLNIALTKLNKRRYRERLHLQTKIEWTLKMR